MSTPLRILHISWEFPPVMYGGLGAHVVAIATEQARAGHDVTVLTQHGTDTPDDEVINGVRLVRAREMGEPQERTFANLLPWVASMQRAMNRQGRELLDAWNPAVVHGHDWVVAAVAMTLSRHAQVPLIATVHATEAGRHDGWIVGPLSQTVHRRERRLVGAADAIIVCSGAMRDEVTAALGPFDAAVTVVPNGVDLDVWRATEAGCAAARARVGVDSTTPLIIYSGRLAHEKGVGTLVDAMPAVLAHISAARLVIAGRGPLDAALRARVSELHLDAAVSFTGFLPEHELRPLVAAADCAVIPSLYEPFGMVALEAGALSTAVVASREGGLMEIITDGVTGLLVTPGQAAPLASAIARLLSDSDFARQLGDAAARDVAIRYSWPLLAQHTVDVYRHTSVSGQQPRVIERIPDMNVLTGERVTKS
ncbi:MAG: glycosyltransferase family 4 protein [Actinomycetes bacterium]